jgi:hypothetical protein
LTQVNTGSEASATAFRLAYAIGQFINRGTQEAWPAQDTLAGIKVDAKSVKRILDRAA